MSFPAAAGDRSGSQSPTQSDAAYHPARDWLDDNEEEEDDGQDMDYEPESEHPDDIEHFDDYDHEDEEDDAEAEELLGI